MAMWQLRPWMNFVKLDETTARDRLNAGLPTTKPRDSALRAVKEVVGIHVLLTRSVSGDDILPLLSGRRNVCDGLCL
jgi:hypothetical protein